jgi:putative membrane protein
MMGLGSGIGWMWLFWLLLLVGVVLLAVVALRAVGGGLTRGNRGAERLQQEPTRARQLLDERYARGELTTEEYRERLRVLGEDS